MLTYNQKNNIKNMENINSKLRATVRTRVTKKTMTCIDDLTFVFENAENFPHIADKITPESIQKLTDAYFKVYRVNIKFSDPKKIIDLLDENAKLKRKNAALMQEMGDLVHRIEHFKYIAEHATSLLEETRRYQLEAMVMP